MKPPLIFVLFRLLLLLPAGYGQLLLSLQKDALYFGETLILHVRIRTEQPLYDVSLSVYHSNQLRYSARVQSTTCDRANLCNQTLPYTKESFQLTKHDEFVFDKIVVRDVSELPIVSSSSIWQTGFYHDSLLELQSLRTEQIQSDDYVIAVLKYWTSPRTARSTTLTEGAAQMYKRSWFNLKPVKIDLQILPNEEIYPNSVVAATLGIWADQTALPVVLKLALPHKQVAVQMCANRQLDGTGVDCTETKVNRQLIDIIDTPRVTSSQGNTQFVVPLASENFTKEIQFLVNKDQVRSLLCTPLCHLDISINIRLRSLVVRPRDILSFGASAQYGPDVKFNVSTAVHSLTVKGPDVELEFESTPSEQVQAGTKFLATLTVRHSSRSTEPFKLVKVIPQLTQEYDLSSATCRVVSLGQLKVRRACSVENAASIPELLDMHDEMSILYDGQVTDAVRLSSTFNIYANVEFALEHIQNISCLPKPCLNGGRCVYVRGANNLCDCPEQFRGADCGQRICPFGWVAIAGGHSCFFNFGQTLDADAAFQKCASQNSVLPWMNSLFEVEELSEYFRQSVPGHINELWIGYQIVSGAWIKLDGTKSTTTDANRKCAFVRRGSNEWIQEDCSTPKPFVCQNRPLYGTGETFSRHVSAGLSTQKIELSSISLGVGSQLRINQPVQTSVALSMPYGHVSQLAVHMMLSSSMMPEIPLRFVYSRVTAPKTLDFDQPELLYVDDKTSQQSPLKRAKRQVESEVKRFVGGITNAVGKGQMNAPVNIVMVSVSTATVEQKGQSFTLQLDLLMNGQRFMLARQPVTVVHPTLQLTKSIARFAEPELAGFSQVIIRAEQQPGSYGDAKQVRLIDDVRHLRVTDVHGSNAQAVTEREHSMQMQLSTLSDAISLAYRTEPDMNLPFGVSYRNTTLTYSSLAEEEQIFPDYPGVKRSLRLRMCFVRADDISRQLEEHNHLLSSTTFVLLFIAVYGITLLLLMACYGSRASAYSYDQARREGRQRNKVIMPPKYERLPNERVDTAEELQADEHLPLAQALMAPNLAAKQRALHRQEVREAAQMERGLAEDEIDAYADLVAALVEQEIPGAETVTQKQRKQLQTRLLQHKINEKQQREQMKKAWKEQQEQFIEQMVTNQQREKRRLARASHLQDSKGDAEREQANLDQVHREELDALRLQIDLAHAMQLEQAELKWKQQRLQLIRDNNKAIIDELVRTGKLDEQEGVLLLAEASERGQAISALLDQRRARQRAALDKRANRRRQLVHRQDASDRAADELLQAAQHEQQQLTNRKKKGLTSAEEKRQKQQARNKHEQAKQKYLAEKQQKFDRIKKRVAKEKREKMNNLIKRHGREVEQLNKKLDRDAVKDPTERVRAREHLRIKHRAERDQVETEQDEALAEQLLEEDQQLIDQIKSQFAQQHTQTLSIDDKLDMSTASHSSTANLLADIETQHRDTMRRLKEQSHQQQQQFDQQVDERVQHEIEEQQALREHEQAMFRHLKAQQSSMSEEERAAVLAEIEANLHALDKSLTVDKLNQLQAQQMAIGKRSRSHNERQARHATMQLPEVPDSESDLNKLRGRTREGLERLQRDSAVTGKQAVNVEKRLLRWRAQQLRAREHMVGKMVAKLELQKVRQQANMEAYDNALESVTACMVEDLNERGLLSNPDCHEIIEQHENNKQQLRDRLNVQKQRHEQQLRQRLQQRAAKAQASLASRQQRQLAQKQQRPYSNDVARHIDTIDIVMQQTRERQHFMQEQDDAHDAQLAAERTRFEVLKQEALQRQEIEMLRTLVNVGGFDTEQVELVLYLVMPDKTETQVQQLVHNICDRPQSNPETPLPRPERIPSSTKKKRSRSATESLVQRIQTIEQNRKTVERKLKTTVSSRKKSSKVDSLPPIMVRPEPDGASSETSPKEPGSAGAGASDIMEYLPPKPPPPHQRRPSSVMSVQRSSN